MRDPKRIPEVLKEIEGMWSKYPDLRLLQLLLNVLSSGEHPYYVEDKDLLSKLKKMYNT